MCEMVISLSFTNTPDAINAVATLTVDGEEKEQLVFGSFSPGTPPNRFYLAQWKALMEGYFKVTSASIAKDAGVKDTKLIEDAGGFFMCCQQNAQALQERRVAATRFREKRNAFGRRFLQCGGEKRFFAHDTALQLFKRRAGLKHVTSSRVSLNRPWRRRAKRGHSARPGRRLTAKCRGTPPLWAESTR